MESDGTLIKEDQKYSSWICVGPVAMFRKSVVRVLGFYKDRKRRPLWDKIKVTVRLLRRLKRAKQTRLGGRGINENLFSKESTEE